jgi:hypothetical protein
MKVLELFAGSRSIGKACEELGHEVFSSDIHPFEGVDYVTDIFDFDFSKLPWIPDIVWASPPCQAFSVACIGRNWVKGEPFTPKTESAELGIKIAKKTLAIIEYLQLLSDSFNEKDLIYYIENPRGKLRKAPFMEALPLCHTVTYCQYGDTRMKPTDIWTNNFGWKPKKACANGDPCHVSAPRGSQTGTQGLKGDYERSKVPHELCLEVLSADIRNSYPIDQCQNCGEHLAVKCYKAHPDYCSLKCYRQKNQTNYSPIKTLF